MFGSGFFVQPNTIDFQYVFAAADLADNVTIYMTLIISLIAYISLMIWARLKDLKDVERLGSAPLPDNNPSDKYVYEITVMTGSKRDASCRSNVFFILTGEEAETDVRTLKDTKRTTFEKGGVDSFVMTVTR